MKIRKGFVSNSSSSSFIVKIHKDLKAVSNEIMAEYDFSFFDVDKLIADIDKQILYYTTALKKDLAAKIEKGDKWATFTIKSTKDRIKCLQKEKKIISRAKGTKLFASILNYYGITSSEVSTKNGKILRLDSWTSMHNSYGESLSELLKEIILFYSFKEDNIIELFNQGDSSC